jgi:hypothetical protein
LFWNRRSRSYIESRGDDEGGEWPRFGVGDGAIGLVLVWKTAGEGARREEVVVVVNGVGCWDLGGGLLVVGAAGVAAED